MAKVIGFISRLLGFDLRMAAVVILFVASVAAGAAWEGYKYGLKTKQGEWDASLVVQHLERDKRLADAEVVASADRASAAAAIETLREDKDIRDERIKKLLRFRPATCGDRIVIDDEWLRHINAVLTRAVPNASGATD